MKRLFDIVVSLSGLILLTPLFIVLGWKIRNDLGSPILFKQKRPGFKEKYFWIYKLRTMKNASDVEGTLLSDADRLTKLGKFLRKTSLDELPELWNVLKGEMSLVGPRPLLMEYLPLYTPEQARRHEVQPGITGWAQVNGRNAISWEEKFKLDLWYIHHHSLCLDIKILWMTAIKVFHSEDINQKGVATMEKFIGSTDR